MAELVLDNINHSYDGGKTWAVRDINMRVESGKQYSMLGPSGCGKTTILKIITGLITPTSGRIFMDDKDITHLPPEKRNVSIVFQFPVVYRMSVLENLLFPLMNVRIPNQEKVRRAKEVAELLGIENLMKEHATKLGPANKQKVAIGRALMKDADVILLDEPMSSIEPDKKYEIKKLLLHIGRNKKKTMIFVTHDQTEALTFGEKIAVMSPNGRLLQFGTFEEVYYRPANEFVGFFIGFPGMNIINARYESDAITIGQLKISKHEVKLPIEAPKDVKIGIRPEHIQVSLRPSPNYLPFKVVYVEYLGRDRYILHLKNGEILMKALYDQGPAPGSDVWIYLPSEHLSFFDGNGWRIA